MLKVESNRERERERKKRVHRDYNPLGEFKKGDLFSARKTFHPRLHKMRNFNLPNRQ